MVIQNFYYFSLCHVCKKSNLNLKKCSNCKVIYYCGRKHQMLDWPNHKNICKAIAKTSELCEIPANSSASDFNNFKYTKSLLWRYELKRELEFVEQQIWMFLKVCCVCYSKEADIICQNCLTVAYCSQEHEDFHRASHQKYCENLKLCLVIYQTVVSEEVPLNWLNFKINKEVQNLPETAEEVLTLMGYTNPGNFSKNHIEYIIMSEYFCPAFNIIYALEESGFVKNHTAKSSKLTIHIVGPDYAEDQMSWVLILEFLSHWIINLCEINIILIGPNLNEEETETLTLNCEECQTKNFTGTLVRIKGLYHDHIHSISPPSLVVALNSGLHEFINSKSDTWEQSIPKLIWFRDVPTVLTAYTGSELDKDLARFEDLDFNYLVTPRRNMYASLRPNRNWEEGSEPVFYQNGYVAIITKK